MTSLAVAAVADGCAAGGGSCGGGGWQTARPTLDHCCSH